MVIQYLLSCSFTAYSFQPTDTTFPNESKYHIVIFILLDGWMFFDIWYCGRFLYSKYSLKLSKLRIHNMTPFSLWHHVVLINAELFFFFYLLKLKREKNYLTPNTNRPLNFSIESFREYFELTRVFDSIV